jgi:hypothetical protein
MNAHAAQPPRWSTSAFPDAAGTSPMELSALGAHVERCIGGRERWFSLRCAIDAVHEFVAPRIMTTLVVAVLAIGSIALML